MYLLVDSGSTKSDWVLLQDDTPPVHAVANGFNPFYFTDESLAEAIGTSEGLKDFFDLPVHLRFFGAGCSDDIQNSKVKHALSKAFTNLASLEVHHDLEGALLATAGKDPGICCILGTGSNACYSDGQHIRQDTPSLGLYLGDEGSGGYLGRDLVKRFFYRQLPDDLNSAFEHRYHLKKDQFLDRIYSQPKPNTYVASFFPFMVEHRTHAFVKSMVRDGFEAFISNHVICYPESATVEIHFIGSVAFLFRDELEECLRSHGLTPGKVIQKPLDGMIENLNLLRSN